MDEPEVTGPKQDSKFKPGQSGNPKGRPLGARSKLSKSFLKDLRADWEEGGLNALQRLRADKPDVYVKVVAELLPKEIDLKAEHDHTHRAVSSTTQWLERLLGEREAGSLPPPVSH
jgi:hypothetical protein